MSTSEKTSSAATSVSSSDLTVECHFFPCGHGDTILLHLPGGHWFLVDCHLTRHDGTFDRFFRFVQARDIRRLEFIVLTHPDIDHFLGMTDVLKYFTSDGRSVGYWCDSGANSQQVRARLPDPAAGRRYAELQEMLDDLDKRNLVRFYQVDRNHVEIGPAGLAGHVDLVVLHRVC